MKNIIIFIVITIFIISCNDGDFDVPILDFSAQNINDCGDLVLFKINEKETLFFELTNNSVLTSDASTVELDGAIVYRIFDTNVSASYFCNEIPPSTPTTQQEWSGSGTLNVVNTITRDDNDTIDEEISDADLDQDGIFNYYDNDDDGDGVLTKNEISIDVNGDLVILDTDGDEIPNYLDNDDDNDGILTINESITADEDGDTIFDFLDSNTVTVLETPNTITKTYTLSYNATFTINDMNLLNNNGNSIILDTFDYGTKIGTLTIVN